MTIERGKRAIARAALVWAALAGGAAAPIAAKAQETQFTAEQRLEIERIVEETIISRMSGAGQADGAEPATLIDATDPERLVQIALVYGSASLIGDVHGDPIVQGEIAGVDYEIFFYGCEDSRACKSVMFRAVWTNNTAPTEDVMRWNREKRFGKAYLDRRGNLVVEMNVNLDYGVTAENLVDTFDWWRTVLLNFVEFFNLPAG